jgi:hypothetical protein
MTILVYRFRGLRENVVCSGGYGDLIIGEEGARALYFKVISKCFSVTNYMKQNPSSQTNSTVAWQKILELCEKGSSRTVFTITCQLPIFWFKLTMSMFSHESSIISSAPRFSKWSLSFYSPHWNSWGPFLLPSTCPGDTRGHSWLSQCASSRNVTGSIPDGVIGVDSASDRNECQEYWLGK